MHFVRRFLLRLEAGLRELVDLEDVFYFEAAGSDTIVRLRERDERVDVRPLEDIEAALKDSPDFFRVHRSYLVNLDWVRFIRVRERRQDWELALDPPVNKVIPIARGLHKAVLKTLGEV